MNFYLDKYRFIPAQLADPPDNDTGIIIVIPCFNEPDLITSLESIYRTDAPKKRTEVIVVFNSGKEHSAEVKMQNRKSLSDMNNWLKQVVPNHISYKTVFVDNLPQKHAGVGLARKIGMDEAVYRFDQIQQDGIIVCFDGDSTCDQNFLTSIETHFNAHLKTPGCSVYFEHPIEGTDFAPEIFQAICSYELHLRYYNSALRYCNLPYAFHTIGSSMAVRSSAYQKQGGMNKRKAGEDFYFLHKIIQLGNFTELNSTRVIPSPRISDRVPFGTGKAIGDYISENRESFYTYNFESFKLIREFVLSAPGFYKSSENYAEWRLKNKPESNKLVQFLDQEKFADSLIEMQKNATTESTFLKRFFVWFDAFRVLKLVHFLRDSGIQNIPVFDAAMNLLTTEGVTDQLSNEKEVLVYMRAKDRQR